jgi:hypothetical protein
MRVLVWIQQKFSRNNWVSCRIWWEPGSTIIDLGICIED